MQMNLKKINIDLIRLVATFMVVAIHIYPLSIFNDALDYTFTRILFRCAVPLFFLITGYYILPRALKDIARLKDYTKKIAKIYFLSIMIYLPVNIYNGYFTNFNIIMLLKDIFINGTFYHLWYFPALILGIWVTYLLVNMFNKKTSLIVVFLYLIGIFGDAYYGISVNIPFLKFIYSFIFRIFNYARNGLFMAPIFLYMGYAFKTNSTKLNFKTNTIVCIISLILMLIEGLILKKFSIPKHTSMYIFLIPLMYNLFAILINSNKSNKTIRNLATWIYILHPLFIIIIRLMSKILNIGFIASNNLILFFLVSILTTAFILIFAKIKHILFSNYS